MKITRMNCVVRPLVVALTCLALLIATFALVPTSHAQRTPRRRCGVVKYWSPGGMVTAGLLQVQSFMGSAPYLLGR